MAGSNVQVSKPMTVREISLKAADFDFNPYIAMKYWLRTADTLFREAQIYRDEENDQQAYLLLMRYAALITEKLPLHPEAKDPENRRSLWAVQKTIPTVVDTLEALKPKINARYTAWQTRAEQSREAANHERSRSDSRSNFSAFDPAIAGNTQTLGAAENSDLAIKIAQRELMRRAAGRKATRQAGISEKEEQERRTAGIWDDWETAHSQNEDDEETRRNMEDSRRRMDGTHDIVPDGGRKRLIKSRPETRSVMKPVRNGTTEYRYPSISKSQPLRIERYDTSPRSSSPSRAQLPPKPPKERFEDHTFDLEPPIPPKQPILAPIEISMPPRRPPSPGPTMPSKPTSFTFRPSAYLENGNPLRTVFLPPSLREEFLKYAAPNTFRNLETCGMLCGTLISNALFIQRVVIPEQTATSDTCDTVNEASFLEYCQNEDLMVLGWIHTHPTQTCFMSSRDLHTHSGYQIMMPEAIAIVCAPSKSPSWGVFRLTDPPGLKSILQCKQTGLFHPHEESYIYTDALRPGHVYEAEGMEFEVVDLRP